MLQLTYDTGAKVTVEGPVDMVMTTAIEAKLSEGKIAAAVPRFARGYTILTPTAEVVDLGTEFGVSVDEVGRLGNPRVRRRRGHAPARRQAPIEAT